jgi:hypothetical protein
MMRTAWILAALAAFGCDDDNPRQRAETPDDMRVDAAGGDEGVSDGGVGDTGPMADGALPDAGSEMGADLGPDLGIEPDLGPVEPEECNGLDDDRDGNIDEDVSNICGGCDLIPGDGCQAWQINLIQNDEGRLNPDRVVGLQGAALGFSEREIPNAMCTVFRQAGVNPDAHLGQVNIDTPLANLNLGPVFDDRRGSHRYLQTPELGPVPVHSEGDLVEVRAGGGLAVGMFTLDGTAPAPLESVDGLQLVADLARARVEDQPIQLRWPQAQADGRGDIRFFVGGSVPIFTNVVYRGIRHYQLDALLRDDGALDLPAGFFGGGVAESAIWARLDRSRTVRLPTGPHSVEMVIGQRQQIQEGGRLEAEGMPPYQIVDPSPNERVITPGDPMRVAWEGLPPGEGPLTVVLTTSDGIEAQQVACEVIDAELGEIELPGDFTEFWPADESALRQLTLRWDLSNTAMPAPDRGQLRQSMSVILRLEP